MKNIFEKPILWAFFNRLLSLTFFYLVQCPERRFFLFVDNRCYSKSHNMNQALLWHFPSHAFIIQSLSLLLELSLPSWCTKGIFYWGIVLWRKIEEFYKQILAFLTHPIDFINEYSAAKIVVWFKLIF